jgi:hypothetical protein
LVRRLSFKTQFKIEFLGSFYGPKKSLKKTLFIPTILTSGVNVRTTWFAEWRFTSVQLIHLDDFRTSCLYLLHFFGFSEFMTESTIGPTWIPGDFVRSPGDREARFQTGRLPVKPGDLASLRSIESQNAKLIIHSSIYIFFHTFILNRRKLKITHLFSKCKL